MERRIEILEQEYASLFDEVGALETRVDHENRKIAENLKSEAAALQAAHKRLEGRLDEAVAGGVHIEVVGLVFFAIGIFVATASPEIASAVGGEHSCSAWWPRG